MAAKSNISRKLFCYCAIFTLILIFVTYFYIRWLLDQNNCFSEEDAESRWRKYFTWLYQREKTSRNCDIWSLEIHTKTIQTSLIDIIKNIFPELTSREIFLFYLFGSLLISVVVFVLIFIKWHRSPNVEMLRNLVQYENNSMHSPHPTNDGHHNRKPFDYKKFFVNLLILVAVVSMPWEFVRLYQREVAKRASHAAQGAPDECTTGSVSLIQTLKSFLHWQFSWSNTNHCEDYYYVLLVDPLWELSPLLVVSSAVTRCVLHPMELLFSGLGRSFRAFFAEIPIQWQPLLLVILTMILLVVILMTCSYRLHIPLLFKIEPKTPVYVQDIKHSNINQNSSYMQMLDTPTNLSGSHIKNGYSENVYQPKKIQNGELFFNAKYIKDEIIIDDSPPEVSIKQTYAEKRKLFYNDTPSLRRDKISKGKDSPKKATKTTRSRKTRKYEEDPNYSDEY